MSNTAKISGLLVVAACLVVGCSKSKEPAGDVGASSTPNAAYLLADKPADIHGVGSISQGEGSDEEVAVEGLIGGSEQPFVDGIAAFTIVDPAIPHCTADEGCPTPWDYCCTLDQLDGNTALVKIVGADGKPVSEDARELLGVKELSKVVVRGKAQRDEQGNLTVLADKVHVVKE